MPPEKAFRSSRKVTPRRGGPLLLDRLLATHASARRGYTLWVALAAFGALGIAWELPSPDQAIPGLWAAALAVAVAIGAAHWSARLVAPLAGIALALSAIVGAVWWLLGPWPLVAIAAVALAIGRAGGGPKVLTVGPIWLAARMVGLSETRPDPS